MREISSHTRVDPAFSYMVLGRYPAQSTTQLISKEWIAKARSRWDVYVSKHGEVPPMGASGVIGLDVGEFGTDANVCCAQYGGYVEKLGTWGGVDTVITGDRTVVEYEGRPSVSMVNVDATGPTESTELGEFYILRDQLWWQP